jgi:hypothetical protein
MAAHGGASLKLQLSPEPRMLARRGEASCMSTSRLVSMIAWTLLGAIAACEDGGPPNPFKRPTMRDAPVSAADGGADASDLEVDDAGS